MNKTFEKSFYVPVPSIAVKHALYKLAEGAGLHVNPDSYESDDLETGKLLYPNILWSRSSNRFCGNSSNIDKLIRDGERILTIDEFVKIIEEHRSRTASFRITDDYTASIDFVDRTLKVGCQTVTFDKLKELYKLIGDRL